MNNKNENRVRLIASVILTLIVSSISRSISGIDENWTVARFIIFLLIGYIIFIIISKIIILIQKTLNQINKHL